MCGICGAVAVDGALNPAISRAVPAMAMAIEHRGPDGQGVWSDPHASLGHRRLAIIDRAGGHQPMSNEDGTVWIAFNGEVYNHHPLRDELEQRGHVFRTHSDTETILHAWEEYGPASVERLHGMFAYAIWDQKKRTFFMTRDRLGKKPIFYAVLGGALHFASEIKALYQSPAWDGTTDLSALEGYLSLGYFLAPHSVYKHVKKLEPGCWLQLKDGRIETRRYWDITQFDTDHRDEGPVLEELDALIGKSVRDRLESEVPLGAFLSGGIDSGLVVSYMSEALGDRLITTSVGFEDAQHNELDGARLTARRFNSRHHDHLLTPTFDDVMNIIMKSFDEPFADASAIPTYYVSKAARQHVIVALTGDGGDEGFSGYDFRYVPHALESRLRGMMPDGPRSMGAAMLARVWPRSAKLPRPLRLHTVLENLAHDEATAYYRDLCMVKPGDVRALMGISANRDPKTSPVYEAVTEPYRRCTSTSAVQRAQYADMKIYLPNDVLVKVDRMSMANSLEVRCPLLDHRVMELAFRLPTSVKMPKLKAKHLLRTLGDRRLPPEITKAPKRGFTAPVAGWLRQYADRYEAEVLRSGSLVSDLLDTKMIGRLLKAHQQGQTEHTALLWSVWMLECWHLGRRAPEPAVAVSA
jgi:asparagine synthase (glutamine-hydrolysing)